MLLHDRGTTGVTAVALLVFALFAAAQAPTESPREIIETVERYAHARTVESSEREIVDYEVGLDALHKIRGSWGFDKSERLDGHLYRRTWQIVDGFSSREVMSDVTRRIREMEGSALLFECEGRDCGRSVQWANRVFNQRVLYGREDSQAYAVYDLRASSARWRLLVYSTARTEDRQYLHIDLLRVNPVGD